MKDVFLVLSIVIAFLSVLPYFRDILRHKTKPNIVTWFTWTLLSFVATIAEYADGEYITALLTGADALLTGTVVVLGLRIGHSRYTFLMRSASWERLSAWHCG